MNQLLPENTWRGEGVRCSMLLFFQIIWGYQKCCRKTTNAKLLSRFRDNQTFSCLEKCKFDFILYYIIIIIVITTILLSWLAVVCYCAQALPPEKVLGKNFKKIIGSGSPTAICSKSTIETLENCVKHFQS